MTVELTVLCEGPTEATFVQSVLRPHLGAYGVYPRAIPLTRQAFGTVPFSTLRRASQRVIGGGRDHQFTTTMVDLYALRDFPDQEPRPGETPADRASRIEAAMHADLPNPRFVPYIQVHEFEALLYVDLGELQPSFPGHDLADAIARLSAEVHGMRPEEIDDGAETAPSKRLIRHVPRYDRAKAYAGPQSVGRIGLTRLRSECPHFAAWLSRLEALAQQGSPNP